MPPLTELLTCPLDVPAHAGGVEARVTAGPLITVTQLLHVYVWDPKLLVAVRVTVLGPGVFHTMPVGLAWVDVGGEAPVKFQVKEVGVLAVVLVKETVCPMHTVASPAVNEATGGLPAGVEAVTQKE